MDAETAENSGIPSDFLHQLTNGTYVHRGMFVSFGPDANCTLDLCPVEWTVYQYRPSLPANITLMVLFSISFAIHIYLGVRWRSWSFMAFMAAGCVWEVTGYIGRIILWKNPWSFAGFMLQMVFITGGPVYFTAAIYVTLSRAYVLFSALHILSFSKYIITLPSAMRRAVLLRVSGLMLCSIRFFAPEISRLPPRAFYWVFISADILCLVLQATGGALSSTSNGASQTGIDVAMAGLILQVIVLVIFCAFFVDYMIRFIKLQKSGRRGTSNIITLRQRLFFGSLAAAIILILARCAYRVDELSEGYTNSERLTNEPLFIGLEGVLIYIAVLCLFIGHPGFGFKLIDHIGDRPSGEATTELVELSKVNRNPRTSLGLRHDAHD